MQRLANFDRKTNVATDLRSLHSAYSEYMSEILQNFLLLTQK
jgi:hypothetical protein